MGPADSAASTPTAKNWATSAIKYHKQSLFFVMADLTHHVQLAKKAVSGYLKRLLDQLESSIPLHVQQTIKQYASDISTTSSKQLVHDIKELRLTAATGTLAVTAVTVVLLLLASSGNDTLKPEKKKKKKKSKLSKAQKANKEIQGILDYVEETFVPQIDKYIETYADLPDTDKEYKFRYCQEMLLKELMKLDGVDVAGNDILRENRKKVIRFIQEHQARLDKFRKDNL